MPTYKKGKELDNNLTPEKAPQLNLADMHIVSVTYWVKNEVVIGVPEDLAEASEKITEQLELAFGPDNYEIDSISEISGDERTEIIEKVSGIESEGAPEAARLN